MRATNLHFIQNTFFPEENKTPATASKYLHQGNVPMVIMYTILHHSSHKPKKMDLRVEDV